MYWVIPGKIHTSPTDGTLEILAGGGVEGSGNPGGRGGLDLKTPLRGSLKMLPQFFRSLTLRKKRIEESSSLSKYAFLNLNAFRFSFKDSAKNITKVIKGENTKKARGCRGSYKACSANQV